MQLVRENKSRHGSQSSMISKRMNMIAAYEEDQDSPTYFKDENSPTTPFNFGLVNYSYASRSLP